MIEREALTLVVWVGNGPDAVVVVLETRSRVVAGLGW
jgi:hypothetical protein